MIHEIRPYTLVPGKAAEYVRLAGDVGLPVRRNDCGTLLGWGAQRFVDRRSAPAGAGE
ncbi:MAG: hypothetical protein WED01_14840 [Candidatus Rokuibacteriota bacterium]